MPEIALKVLKEHIKPTLNLAKGKKTSVRLKLVKSS